MKINTALTTQEVAYMLKIAKNTVYELVKRGELNSYKVGRNLRFSIEDIETYVSNSKSIQIPQENPNDVTQQNMTQPNPHYLGQSFIICGQDIMLDILANYLENHEFGVPTLRAHSGSYSSLTSLYYGNVQLAATHLWDGDSNIYNTPFVRRLLPGIPSIVIHLTKRMQGFYVAEGNPKNITSWKDFKRTDVIMINREKGAGSRVLLDEHLRLLGISSALIKGYNIENHSPLTVASTVARCEADVAIGNEKTASQFTGLDFIPMQNESYDLVIKREDLNTKPFRAILDILNSQEFKSEFEDLIGYDISNMGTIVSEV